MDILYVHSMLYCTYYYNVCIIILKVLLYCVCSRGSLCALGHQQHQEPGDRSDDLQKDRHTHTDRVRDRESVCLNVCERVSDARECV